MTARIARCCCGALRAEVTGEPPRVGICHCMECQRRTGSSFGVVAFFPKEQVSIEGPSNVYVRRGDSGRKVEFHFCPNCGTSVFWYAEFRPDHVGIAFGAFADPSMMPWPATSVWETTRHPWLTFDHPIERFTDQGLTPATTALGRRDRHRSATRPGRATDKWRPARAGSARCTIPSPWQGATKRIARDGFAPA